MKKRLFSIFIILTFFVNLFLSNTVKVWAKEYGDYGDYGIFYTHETDEYLKQPTDSLLKYQVITDSSGNLTNEVSAIGSYILTNTGIDETKSASEVTIPESVTYNGVNYSVTKTQETFYGKKEVKIVNFSNSIVEIGFDTLSASGITKFHMLSGVKYMDPQAMQYCAYLKEVTVDSKNPFYKSYKNFLYTKDSKRLITTANLGKKVSVPNGITAINGYALNNCIYFNGEYSFMPILNVLILPSSISELEENSIPDNVMVIKFNTKSAPKVKCDLTGKNGPILLVPTGGISSYQKLSYNGTKILANQVVTSLKTKTALANKKRNDEFIKNLKWNSKKEDIYFKSTSSQINEFIKYYKNIANKYTNDTDKANAILVDVLNNIYINHEYYGKSELDLFDFPINHPELASLYGMYKNMDKGTIRLYAVSYAVAALNAGGIKAEEVYPLVNGASSVENNVIFCMIDNKLVIIDITKEMATFNGGVKINFYKGFELKYYNISYDIFNYSSKIFGGDL